MTGIKPLNAIRKKWETNASSAQASEAYKQGVTSPRADWKDRTVASDDARKAGLVAADARNAFVKGVEEAGTSKWKERSLSLGPSRFSQGVKVTGDDYMKGFSPFHAVIAGLSLPPRGPKGSPDNIERVKVIAEALHKEKIGA